jgi:hypothetical protein
MTKIILLVMFLLCCNNAREQQYEQNAKEPTMLTEVLKAYDTVSCAELTDKSEVEEKYPSRRERCDEYCQKVKVQLKGEFDLRYKMLKNDTQYSVNYDKSKRNGYSEEIWYEKRFGTSISDFERLITHIDFYIGGDGALEFTALFSYRFSLSLFSVTKTATGAVVKYNRNEFIEPMELELNINEWMDFIRVLYKSCINRWEKEYDKFRSYDSDDYFDYYTYGGIPSLSLLSTRQWKLELYSSDKNEPDECYGFDGYPNWLILHDAIDTIKSRIYREEAVKIEAQLKINYQTRFGEPITDSELSTMNISYYSSSGIGGSIYFFATRTTTGGFVECKLLNDWFTANINTDEWLDFIRDLYKSTIEWESWNDTFDYSYGGAGSTISWSLVAYALDKSFLSYSGFTTRALESRPNSKEFINVMINMTEKVKMKDKQRQIDSETNLNTQTQ